VKTQTMIRKDDFIKYYTPTPGFALVEKDKSGEKIGSLWIPKNIQDRSVKFAGTGVVKKLSPFVADREPYDACLREIFKVGQRVAFSNTTPFDINLPAFCTMSEEDKGSLLVLLHTADILGIIDLPEDING